jgi:hypothetical protein
MAAPLAKSLIVVVGEGRPFTCFSFSQPRQKKDADARDEPGHDEGDDIVTARRLQ